MGGVYAYSYLYQSSRSLPFTSDLSKTVFYVPAIPPSELRTESARPALNAMALAAIGGLLPIHRQ